MVGNKMIKITRRELLEMYTYASTQEAQDILGPLVNIVLNDMNPSNSYIFFKRILIQGK